MLGWRVRADEEGIELLSKPHPSEEGQMQWRVREVARINAEWLFFEEVKAWRFFADRLAKSKRSSTRVRGIKHKTSI
jgi:hypothetical protein